MKKLLLLLFSLLISFNSLGETGCSEKDDKEDFINSTTYFQERGGLLYLPNQSKPYSGENLCIHKNSSGQYFSKGEIRNGKRHGKMTFWDENGQIYRERDFKDGVLVSNTFYEYFYPSDQIESVNNYKVLTKDGIQGFIKDGKWTYWHENGQKNREENYKNGVLDGIQKWWHENGQIFLKGNFKDDKPDGKYKEWDENGQIVFESNWKDGDCISGDCPD